MSRIQLHTPAPDFTLDDFNGQPIQLSDFRGTHHVILVFNRGFA